MRINLVVNSFPNTSETFLFNLVTGLELKGHLVTVCAYTKSKNLPLFKNRMKEWSGRIVYIPTARILDSILCFWQILFQPYLFLEITKRRGIIRGYLDFISYRYLTKNKPDIVHFAFSGIAINYIPTIDLINRVTKTVVSCRGSSEKVRPLLDPKRKKELAELFSKVHCVHCVSRDMKDTILEYGLEENKSFINYPSINVNTFKYKERNNVDLKLQRIKIVTTGRLHFQKGYIYALGAIHKLVQKGFDIEYTILGEGPDKDLLIYLINEFDLVSQVKLTGKVSSDEVYSYLNEAHLFLLPSLYEGIANAALEAMAVGLPIVTTNSGGMNEVVKDGINGRIVERFSEEALASAILDTISDYSKAIYMTRKAFETIKENHNLDKQIKVFEDNYQYLITKPSEFNFKGVA